MPARFDYAGDAWGYTYGAAAEWYQGRWTLRGGVFDLSVTPAGGVSPFGSDLDPTFRQFQLVGEIEERHELWGEPGKLKITGFLSRGDAGEFADAIALAQATGMPADINAVRRYASRPGVSVNLEQQVTETVGVFARAGWADGNVEPWDFTDIDRTVSAGVSINGKQWGRPDDTVGVAGVVNGISGVHAAFLNAGGLGILIGDGQLPHPGARGDHRDLLQLRFDRGDEGQLRLSVHRQPGLQHRSRAGDRFSPGGFTRSSEAQRLNRSALREPVPREHLAHRIDELILRHGALRLRLFLQMLLAAFFQLRQFGADDQVLDGDSRRWHSSRPSPG